MYLLCQDDVLKDVMDYLSVHVDESVDRHAAWYKSLFEVKYFHYLAAYVVTVPDPLLGFLVERPPFIVAGLVTAPNPKGVVSCRLQPYRIPRPRPRKEVSDYFSGHETTDPDEYPHFVEIEDESSCPPSPLPSPPEQSPATSGRACDLLTFTWSSWANSAYDAAAGLLDVLRQGAVDLLDAAPTSELRSPLIQHGTRHDQLPVGRRLTDHQHATPPPPPTVAAPAD